MNPKELTAKLHKSTALVQDLRKKNRDQVKTIRDLRASRSQWSAKCRKLSVSYKALEKNISSLDGSHEQKIARHKYSVEVVGLLLNMCILGGCSLRGSVAIARYLRSQWGIVTGSVPCKSSVSNWIKKAGYYVHDRLDIGKYAAGYGLIIDECMAIGQERMLMVLLVSSRKEDIGALERKDVAIMQMEVKASWNVKSLSELLEKVGEKMGKKADYVICDGAKVLGLGIAKAGLVRVCDCGHEVARLTGHIWAKDAGYTAFSKALAQSRLKYIMTAQVYLLPPTQRVIARFMNIKNAVEWALKVLYILENNPKKLTEAEYTALVWVLDHKASITELSLMLACSDKILPLLKNNGLSHKTMDECLAICTAFDAKGNTRLQKWVAKITAYLGAARGQCPDGHTVWHISSDIIESFFGIFKAQKADNNLHGVTPWVLALPLQTKIDTENNHLDVDFKAALEQVFLSDIDDWANDHLAENQVVKRNKFFKK